MDEGEALATQRAPELDRVRRQTEELASEEQPAPAAVCRRPDVREAGDGSRVDDRARRAEELGRRAGRAVDVRLEAAAVELEDQVRERFRRAAELGAMVHEEHAGGVLLRHRPMLVRGVVTDRCGRHDAVSPPARGTRARSWHAVEALRGRTGSSASRSCGTPGRRALLPVETVVVRERPSMVWKQVGLPAARAGSARC